jgi:hypothetical protein
MRFIDKLPQNKLVPGEPTPEVNGLVLCVETSLTLFHLNIIEPP